MTNVSSEINHREGSVFLSVLARRERTCSRCLIKITIIWAFRVAVMRPMDRLSAAVHVPDNRAASIIPLQTSLPLPASLLVALASVIKTKLQLGLSNVLSCDPGNSPTSWPRRSSERVGYRWVTDCPCRIFANVNLNTAYAQASSTLVEAKLRVIGDVCCNVHLVVVARWIIVTTDDKVPTENAVNDVHIISLPIRSSLCFFQPMRTYVI